MSLQCGSGDFGSPVFKVHDLFYEKTIFAVFLKKKIIVHGSRCDRGVLRGLFVTNHSGSYRWNRQHLSVFLSRKFCGIYLWERWVHFCDFFFFFFLGVKYVGIHFKKGWCLSVLYCENHWENRQRFVCCQSLSISFLHVNVQNRS